MTINTNLNVSPYFDDFDEANNYLKILFKAGTAVQARELTQLQSILQSQIERFGKNILIEGTIVDGGNFVDYKKLPYVKILDNNVNNQPIAIENYNGTEIVGQLTGVGAKVITVLGGYTSQKPDLNTLYLKYTRTGQDALGNDVKTFLAGETLEFYSNGVLQSDLTISVASLATDDQPVGYGYGVSCGDGIIFQKGFFTKFEDQIAIVSKYNTTPTDLVVGFRTEEFIIDSNSDTSLLDNANGFNNFNAPGADRLKLTPKLVVLNTAQGVGDSSFFAIQEYKNGKMIKRKDTTEFNSVNKVLKKRTAEESGNYSLGNFVVSVEEDKQDPTSLIAVVNPGVAYVGGERIEIISSLSVPLDKATEFGVSEQQNILANYGQYIEVENLYGSFSFNLNEQIKLSSVVQSATSIVGFTPSTIIGYANVRSVTKVSTNIYRLYLFNISMVSGNSFSAVRSAIANDNTAFCNLILEAGKNSIKDSSFKSMIFPIGKEAIKEIVSADTDYTYRTSSTLTANSLGGFSLSLTGDNEFAYGASATLNTDQKNELLVSYSGNGAVVAVSTATTDPTAKILSVTLAAAVSASIDVSYNAKKKNVKPIGKNLTTVYMRIDPSANTLGTYHLGWPDVYSIEKIWKGTTNSFTEATPGIVDVTNNFTLFTNQKTDFYDISYVKKKSSVTVNSTDRFLVKAKVFQKVTTGSFDQTYFEVGSYPVDDISEVLPSNKIRTENIPSYRDETGKVFELRDSIDFRPYSLNLATYATSEGTATIWSNSAKLNTVTFGTSDLNIPSPNSVLEASYEYYLSRIDRLIIDEKGNFQIMKGVASEQPVPPNSPNSGMSLAKIIIPPYPSLTSKVANRSGKSSYGISISNEDNKRYTMRDIGDIEKRINRIEYYSVLNALEKAAEDLVVLDSTGLNRFKNGILVDNFDNLLIGDVKNNLFSASVDPSYRELSPSFNNFFVDLKLNSSTGVSTVGDLLSLQKSSEVLINQPYASHYRNCVTDFYTFKGTAEIFPEYDSGYEETYAPDINFSVDLTTPFTEFTEQLNNFVPLQTVNTSNLVTSSVLTVGSTTTVTTNTSSTTTTRGLEISPNIQTSKVGDFVTDFSFNPFMRSKILNVFVSGLRPNTRFYFYFDGVDVNANIASAVFSTTGRLQDLTRTSEFGNGIRRSNSNGELTVMFSIPENKFFVGDRDLLIVDVDSLNSLEASTSSAIFTYRAFNYSVEKTSLEISTRTPSFSTDTSVVTTNRSTSTTVVARERGSGENGGRWGDPIAQTFSIESDQTDDNSVLLSELNLYFKSKDPVLGATVQIRNTVNGYPGQMVLPFGSVRLKSSDIQVSDNGSAATVIAFNSPIALKANSDYCIVIIPDGNNPNYLVFVNKIGEKDLITGNSITNDSNSGTLFTSTNNKAWTPYQNENMKFLLKKAIFTSTSGSVSLRLDDYEFFDVEEGAGTFKKDETVFAVKTPLGGSISAAINQSIITGTSTTFSTNFTVGDQIAWLNSSGKYEVHKIDSIQSNLSITVDGIIKTAISGVTNYFKTVSGKLDYQNTKTNRLHLKKSTAKIGNVFENSSILVGELSNATASLASVSNIPVSYTQNNIQRVNFMNTQTTIYYSSLSNGTSNYLPSPIISTFDNNNYLSNTLTYLKSRSNEITENSGARTFLATINLQTKSQDVSPLLDIDISSINFYEFIVNNDLTNEETDSGLSKARYFTKSVTLADGFDAEDIKVWLTAHRPTGSDITVYAKFKSETDPISMEELPWTKLSRLGSSDFTSSLANRSDFKEFEYYLPTAVSKGPGEGAYLNSSNEFRYVSVDGSIFENYKYFSIKIVMTSVGAHRIPRVKDMRAIALT